MARHLFEAESEIITAFADGDSSRTMRNAPKAVSAVPILVGTIIILIGTWLLSAAINLPIEAPELALGAVVSASSETTEIAIPSELSGTVNVLVELDSAPPDPEEADGGFSIIDARGESVGRPLLTGDVLEFIGFSYGPPGNAYLKVAAVDAAADGAYRVVTPAGWSGRMAFIPNDDLPVRPDWRSIIESIALILVGAAIATVWTIRRLRWRRDINAYKADMTERGYVID